jgi:hypothetical protein
VRATFAEPSAAEMKEYLPTRIEVTKNHLGSQVTVV